MAEDSSVYCCALSLWGEGVKAVPQTLMGEGCGPRLCKPSPDPFCRIAELPSPAGRGRNNKRPYCYAAAAAAFLAATICSAVRPVTSAMWSNLQV
jgi:hypothetical protein